MGEIFAHQLRVLGDCPVVEIMDAKVIDHKEQKGKTKQRRIQAIRLRPHPILYHPLDAKHIERLDEQVHQNEEYGVEKEFSIHVEMAVLALELEGKERLIFRKRDNLPSSTFKNVSLPSEKNRQMFVPHFLIKALEIKRDDIIIESEDLKSIEISFKRPLTDDELWEIGRQNPDYKIEQDKNGKLHIKAPVGFNGGIFEDHTYRQLSNWRFEFGKGQSLSVSTGFKLPDGSTHAADGAWVSDEKIAKLTAEQRKKFAPIVPDFVIEVRSESDTLKALKNKMKTVWIKNGVRLAWLIDPLKQKAYIYRQDGSTAEIKDFEQKLSGEDVCPDFEFDLSLLKL